MKSKNHVFTAVITDNDPLNRAENFSFGAAFAGRSAASVLEERLTMAGITGSRVFVTSSKDSAGRDAAARMGWKVLRRDVPLYSPAALYALSRACYWLFFDLQYPFVDPGRLRTLLSHVWDLHPPVVRVMKGKGILPQLVVRKNTVLSACFEKLFTPRSKTILETVLKSSSPLRLSCDVPPHSSLLRTGMMEGLPGRDIDDGKLGGDPFNIGAGNEPDHGEVSLARARARLVEKRDQSVYAHLWNERLSDLEAEFEVPVMAAYPVNVVTDITSRCNARCSFCNHPHLAPLARERFTLDDFKRMEWLRYVKQLGLSGRLGDPLCHPQCSDIVEYLRGAYPHLHLYLTTNGIGLNEALCRVLAETMDRVIVSLNAANSITWEALMGVRGFDRVVRSLGFLNEAKRSKKTRRLRLELSMVVTRHNIGEMSAFVELAGRLDASKVLFDHFTPDHMTFCSLPAEASPYFDQIRFDRELLKAERTACRLGLRMVAPPAFACKAELFQATRAKVSPVLCRYPWKNCLLADNPQMEPKLEFCCTAFDSLIRYGREDLGEKAFLGLWNHPIMGFFRKTANHRGENPVCDFCRGQDQQLPATGRGERLKERYESVCRRTGIARCGSDHALSIPEEPACRFAARRTVSS